MLEEREHAVVLRTLAGGSLPTPRSTRFCTASDGTCAAPVGSATRSTASTTGLARSSASCPVWRATTVAAKSCSPLAWPVHWRARCRWALARTCRRNRSASSTSRKSRGNASRSKTTRTRRSASWNCSISSRAFPPRNRARWRSGFRRSRSNSCARWYTRSSGFGGNVPETVALDHLGERLDRHRRIHPHRPVLLHRLDAGRRRIIHHQHGRPLRGRRVEGARHDAIVVGQRTGNDDGGHPGGCDHLWARRRLRGHSGAP